jgi:hypothetical protein
MTDATTSPAQPEHPISYEWRRWAAVSVLSGAPVVDVIATLTANGTPEGLAVQWCAELYDDPVFEAGRWVAEQLAKLHSVLDMQDRMRGLSDIPRRIERRSGLSSQDFLDHYYAANTPVILTDVCDRWPARQRWTPAYLTDVLGHEEVEVMANRDADPLYELNADEHKYRMPFDDYVAQVLKTEWGNDLYLVANNNLLKAGAAAPLWEDLELDERYLRPDDEHRSAFLWFGPAGTVTPLHHDTSNILFNQVDGWKQFTLISALEIHKVYNNVAVYSDVDPRAPDLDRYPRFADAHPLRFNVGPGETLFIPAGWWHHVESLETSISVSFTNFAFANQIEWAHPSLAI